MLSKATDILGCYSQSRYNASFETVPLNASSVYGAMEARSVDFVFTNPALYRRA